MNERDWKRDWATSIAERAGISAAGGTFSTYISRLRTRELINGNRGVFVASEELFS